MALALLGLTSYGQEPSTNSNNSTPSKPSFSENNAEGWKRYYLEGPNGDIIGVYLPKKPDRFPGSKLRGGQNVISADVYLVAENEEVYSVVFVYDLAGNAQEMPDDQKAEIFFGSWRGTIEHVRQALEKKMDRSVEVRYSEQSKVKVSGKEGPCRVLALAHISGRLGCCFHKAERTC